MLKPTAGDDFGDDDVDIAAAAAATDDDDDDDDVTCAAEAGAQRSQVHRKRNWSQICRRRSARPRSRGSRYDSVSASPAAIHRTARTSDTGPSAVPRDEEEEEEEEEGKEEEEEEEEEEEGAAGGWYLMQLGLQAWLNMAKWG